MERNVHHTNTAAILWGKQGGYLDALEACTLSENSNDLTNQDGGAYHRYMLLLKKRRTMHSDATLMNELERTRLEVILKQLEIEKSLQATHFRKQELRLHRSLELLEGYKEKLKNKLSERAHEIHRRNDRSKFSLRDEENDHVGYHYDDYRTESELRRARQLISERDDERRIKPVSLEFRLPPLVGRHDKQKLWANPLSDDGSKYERAKHIYGRQTHGTDVLGDGSMKSQQVRFLPGLEMTDKDRHWIKFAEGVDKRTPRVTLKGPPATYPKSCLKKIETSPEKIMRRSDSQLKELMAEHCNKDKTQRGKLPNKTRVSFPPIRHYPMRENNNRENWLRRVKEAKKRRQHGNRSVQNIELHTTGKAATLESSLHSSVEE